MALQESILCIFKYVYVKYMYVVKQERYKFHSTGYICKQSPNIVG